MTFAFVKDEFNYVPTASSIQVVLTGVTAGNLIVAFFKHEQTPTTYTLSDGTSSLTIGTEVDHSNNDLSAAFAYLLDANSGTRTYTLTLGASRNHVALVVKEFSYDGTCELDQQSIGQGSGTGATSGSISTTGSECIAIGGVAQFSAGASSNHQIDGAAGNNLEPTGTTSADQCRAWDRVGTVTSGAATITVPSDDWICNIIAFKEAGGGGGGGNSATIVWWSA